MTRISQVVRARLHLLNELRSGIHPPGTTLSIKSTAEALAMSPTPIREALERLVGEGSVTVLPNGNGFATPRMGTRSLADLYEHVGHLLDTAIRLSRFDDVDDGGFVEGADPLAITEKTFERVIASCRNAEVSRAITRAGTNLASYRRIEPRVLPGWSEEIGMMRRDLYGPKGRKCLQAYFRRRVAAAPRIFEEYASSHDIHTTREI